MTAQTLSSNYTPLGAGLTCCACQAFALWTDAMTDYIQSSYLTLNLNIKDIIPSNIDCTTQTETVIVQTCGYPDDLEFQLDDGYPQHGNPVFNNVGNGPHTVTVTDHSDPYALQSTFDFTVNILPCPSPVECLPANKLFLAGKYSHGAPIQSVAWSCPT